MVSNSLHGLAMQFWYYGTMANTLQTLKPSNSAHSTKLAEAPCLPFVITLADKEITLADKEATRRF